MRIRRVNSYRSPHLSFHQLSGMSSPDLNRTERVRPVSNATSPYSEMPQLNKYEEQTEGKPSTTVSEFAQSRNTITASEGFKTVTLHLEKYEQMRRDQQKLMDLEKELQEMIRLIPQPPSQEGVETVRIELHKQNLQAFAKRRIESETSKSADHIDCSDIQLI